MKSRKWDEVVDSGGGCGKLWLLGDRWEKKDVSLPHGVNDFSFFFLIGNLQYLATSSHLPCIVLLLLSFIFFKKFSLKEVLSLWVTSFCHRTVYSNKAGVAAVRPIKCTALCLREEFPSKEMCKMFSLQCRGWITVTRYGIHLLRMKMSVINSNRNLLAAEKWADLNWTHDRWEDSVERTKIDQRQSSERRAKET